MLCSVLGQTWHMHLELQVAISLIRARPTGELRRLLKYLRKTRDLFLVYGAKELVIEGFTDSSFQSDVDDFKSTSGYVFLLNGGAVTWKSNKQATVADSTTEAEYIAASEAAKEGVWIKNFVQELGVVPSCAQPIVVFCDNNGAIAPPFYSSGC